MNEIISALWPVFMLLLLGYWAQRQNFPGPGFWQQAEKGTYYVLFPVMLVEKLSTAPIDQIDLWQTGTAVLLLLLLGSAAVLACRKLISGAAAFTSVYQGAVRFNTYVGLAAAAVLYGDPGLAQAAVIAAFMIPLLNLFCVLVFVVFVGGHASWMNVLKTLLTNPLIVGSLLGLGLNLTDLGLHPALQPVMGLLGQMALPMGLLAVGAGLSFHFLLRSWQPVLLATLIKLLVFPLLAVGLANLVGLPALSAQLLLLFAALPTASSAYILARQMGGDAQLMAGIITGQTLLAMLTMPLLLGLLAQWL
ncbi:AEC family transporter [Pontibacter sp. JAM-7]|uniref:AEC family transporter n=1 Tax=Pontibacter sp. JAM-7 TaxID=3366581 RepID=UPI003AF85F12